MASSSLQPGDGRRAIVRLSPRGARRTRPPSDTIVIFDRVRENLATRPGDDLRAVLNTSITETLPRTLLTGGTTLATALVLIFLAGEVIRPFALVMGFGIVVGTFSSIYIAAPVLLGIHRRWGVAETGVVEPRGSRHRGGAAPR